MGLRRRYQMRLCAAQRKNGRVRLGGSEPGGLAGRQAGFGCLTTRGGLSEIFSIVLQ
jgi:hypothetical protein